MELYVASRLEELDRHRQQYELPHRTPGWAQWFARGLVRLAVAIGGEQVRIDRPARWRTVRE
jgi:hypothetical protein